MKSARGFGSLKITRRLPKKKRRICDTIELQVKAIRATMDTDRIEMREEFVILFLTDEKELITGVSLYRGTSDQVTSSLPEIIQAAAIAGAYYIVTSHNHPNGYAQPSYTDMDVASHMAHALRFCGMELLDAIVVTRKKYFSFEENSLLRH